MTVWMRCDVKPGFSFHYRALAEHVIDEALTAEGFPFEAEVSVLLTDNDGIRHVNRETRGIDAATDVLSFPMLDYPAPADFSFLETEWETYTDPDTEEIALGDIVLSVDKVREQARSYGHSEKREYAFLLVHSMLHLMGYDHIEPEERERMEERQRVILDVLRIGR